MKILIVYYSLEGNTKYVAEKIAEQTVAEVLRLEPEKAYPAGKVTKYLWGGRSAVMGDAPKLMSYEAELSDYEMIVFGTPVWASPLCPTNVFRRGRMYASSLWKIGTRPCTCVFSTISGWSLPFGALWKSW